ncbi:MULTISPECIES: TolC family protein [Anaeromyxobacter]|uniref:TolC family protein n=1 Tax=Anaeromyxobacter TaxID=161492 RepID=UPI001F5A98EF|nr:MULTISPECIES: TolC family protein [unclassified Anaeromyxobacter]
MRPAALAPLLALVAATLAPPASAQEAPLEAQAAPAQAPSGAPGAAAAPRDVISLDGAVRAALEHQPRLRQALATTEAAGARTDQARAPLLPQVDLEGQVGRRGGSTRSAVGGTSSTSGLGLSTSTTTWSAGASARQALVDVQQLERWRSAGASAEAQRATARATEQQIVAQVRTAWFAARAARDLVQVSQDSLANQEAHLRQVEAFVEVGTRPAIDLAQARADRANAQVALIRAGNDYVVTRAQLVQAMGVDRAADFDLGDGALSPVPGEEGPVDPLLAEALAARPELAALGSQARSDVLSRDAARAGWLPTLSAGAAVTGVGPAVNELDRGWNATVTLGWSIFQGGLTRAQTREAEANLAATEAQTDALRQQVRVEVEQARAAVQAARAALDAAGEALVNARERLRLAEGRYQAGAGSIIELGDAQVAATSAAAQRVQAEQSVSSARAQLLLALGRAVR